jgi:hypothetical protein
MNESERIFTSFVLVLGAAIYAAVFATVTTLIGKLDQSGARYQSRLTTINEFFKVRHHRLAVGVVSNDPSAVERHALYRMSAARHWRCLVRHPCCACCRVRQMHELPDKLKQRTVRYLDAQWRLESGIDFQQVFMELPEFLKADIKLKIHGSEVAWTRTFS